MSVLSFPRIYFKGYMGWDPCTFNNNDWKKFPTYDAANAALNWEYLSTQGITPANFTTKFRPWAITLQPDNEPPAGERVPCEWNMFGSHSVSFVQYQNPTMGPITTTIIGGDRAYNQPSTGDPIIGNTVAILGDTGSGTSATLVDTNPTSPWSSQIYFGQFQFGNAPNTTTGQRVYRMHSRWLNPNRIYGAGQSLTSPAASIGCCFQTGIPYNMISWPTASTSQLINDLKTAAGQPGALGIMIRFTAYVNLYFQNGIFNGAPPQQQPRDYTSLAAALATAWQTYNTTGSTSGFFSNPCYSHIVGVIGVWNQGELASVPGGRCLNPSASVTPVVPATMSKAVPKPGLIVGHEVKPAASASTDDSVLLGPAAVNVDNNASLISLDFSGVIPEMPGDWPNDVAKANFRALTLGVIPTGGQFTPIAVINYNQYQQSAYEAKAGIIDIPFSNSDTGKLLQSGAIAIKVEAQAGSDTYALMEQPYTAETDTRGIYLDQNEPGAFDVTVSQMGKPPTSPVNLLVAKYEPTDAGLSLIPSTKAQLVNITNGTPVTVPVGPGVVSNAATFVNLPNGVATVKIAPQNPGFPVLAFFPYSGSTLPTVPDTFNFTNDAFFTTIRVLPFDDNVPGEFLQLWESTNDPNAAWNFVYREILYVYDMLFNVMLGIVNLGSKSSVDSSKAAILSVIPKEVALESTKAMPITRDLSAGKRLTLQYYLNKVVQ